MLRRTVSADKGEAGAAEMEFQPNDGVLDGATLSMSAGRCWWVPFGAGLGGVGFSEVIAPSGVQGTPASWGTARVVVPEEYRGGPSEAGPRGAGPARFLTPWHSADPLVRSRHG